VEVAAEAGDQRPSVASGDGVVLAEAEGDEEPRARLAPNT
jgi:hypothetical protein